MLKNAYLFCFLVGFSAAAYVDNLPKCTLKDSACLKNIPTTFQSIAKTGIPEIGIPVLEPMEIDGLTISFLGVLNITLTKGKVIGISGCTFDAFEVDLEKGSCHQENTCSLVLEGQYNISPNAIIESVLGKDGLSGAGNTKITIDNLHTSFDVPVYAQKRDDGEIYITVDYKNAKFDYEIKGLEIAANNIVLGGLETSETVIPVLNHNWKFLLKIFGKPLVVTAVEVFTGIADKFFLKTPAKHFINDDLTSIAKP